MTRPVVVHKPRPMAGATHGIAAEIEAEGRIYDVFFRSTYGPLSANGDPFLVVALLPAMRLGAPIVVEAPILPLLLEHVSTFQDIFSRWFPDFVKSSITVASASLPAASAGEGVGAFFTGGIDSSYTVLKQRPHLTHLLFVHGFDLPLGARKMRRLVGDKLAAAAGELGVPLVEIETNLRHLLDRYADWDWHSHGTGLGAVALALAPQFRRVHIAASEPYDNLQPYASHALTDPLWGTEHMRVVHDGAERTRWEKAEQVLTQSLVQRHLRVCWHYQDGKYNCGRCVKCLRVMALVRAMGMVKQYATLPPLEDLDLIRQLPITKAFHRLQVERILAIAERWGRDQDVIAALRDCLARPEVQRMDYDYHFDFEQASAHIAILRQQLTQMASSRSWRLTAPLRAVGDTARRVHRRFQP